MNRPAVEILVISLSAPFLIGIYQNGALLKSYRSSEKTSEALPPLMQEILREYHPVGLYFARGPGSFMAIKITYIFLQTLAITLDLPLLAADGFAFNQNSPIKAVGTLYFSKENGKIRTRKIDTEKEKIQPFALPKQLDRDIFTKENEPLYILPAV